jgi:predicted MFS family arabinose efflux permease
MAIVTDLFAFEQRGRVMGIMQTAFGASSVLGIPIGLLLSTHWGWNKPFLMIVTVSALVGVFIKIYLRPVDAHLELHPDRSPLHHLLETLTNSHYVLGFAATGLMSVGGFMLMPFISLFTVNNIGLPIGKLPLMYTVTGLASLLTGPLIGRASDGFGKFRVFFFGCIVTIVMVSIYTHLHAVAFWTVIAVLIALHVGIFSRMISSSALTSALPQPADRGAYMSISSSLQQVSGGVAAVLAGSIVRQSADGTLLHFERVGYVLIGTTLMSLGFMYLIDRRVGRAMQPIVSAASA